MYNPFQQRPGKPLQFTETPPVNPLVSGLRQSQDVLSVQALMRQPSLKLVHQWVFCFVPLPDLRSIGVKIGHEGTVGSRQAQSRVHPFTTFLLRLYAQRRQQVQSGGSFNSVRGFKSYVNGVNLEGPSQTLINGGKPPCSWVYTEAAPYGYSISGSIQGRCLTQISSGLGRILSEKI